MGDKNILKKIYSKNENDKKKIDEAIRYFERKMIYGLIDNDEQQEVYELAIEALEFMKEGYNEKH